MVTSLFLTLAKDPKRWEQKDQIWANLREHSEELYNDLRAQEISARFMTIPGAWGRELVRAGYAITNFAVGFNS